MGNRKDRKDRKDPLIGIEETKNKGDFYKSPPGGRYGVSIFIQVPLFVIFAVKLVPGFRFKPHPSAFLFHTLPGVYGLSPGI